MNAFNAERGSRTTPLELLNDVAHTKVVLHALTGLVTERIMKLCCLGSSSSRFLSLACGISKVDMQKQKCKIVTSEKQSDQSRGRTSSMGGA